jgi:signal transduction histidine kinase
MSWAWVNSRRDRVLPVVLTILAVIEVLVVHPDYSRVVFVPLAVVLPLSLLARKRHPLAVLATNVAAWVLIDMNSPKNEDPLALALTLAIAVYSTAAHTAGRRAVAGALLTGALVGTATVADTDDWTVLDFLGNALFFCFIFGGIWIGGRAIRRRRLREGELIVEREQKARAAVLAERSRIARELHDVVAHAISVIILQARGARRSLGSEPESARGAIDAIEETASQALTEMRRLLEMLRADDEAVGLAPQPSLAHLQTLADQVRDAGLPVEIELQGEERELAPGVDLAAFRIVQEALTNALKHAGPARARVVVRYGGEDVELEIADDGAGGANGAGAGHGLAGMRERVSLYGGRLESGPTPGGGFLVRARLPG